MEKHVSVALAAKFEEVTRRLSEAVDLMRDIHEFAERAPFNRAIGNIFGIVSDEIYARPPGKSES